MGSFIKKIISYQYISQCIKHLKKKALEGSILWIGHIPIEIGFSEYPHVTPCQIGEPVSITEWWRGCTEPACDVLKQMIIVIFVLEVYVFSYFSGSILVILG